MVCFVNMYLLDIACLDFRVNKLTGFKAKI